MPRPTLARQRGPNGRFLSSHASATTSTAQNPVDLFVLPPEIRLAIYKCLFSRCTLRRLKGFPPRTNIELFNNSILTACKRIHTEALPLFYASQTFHYPAELNGQICRPTMKKAHLKWVKHISIEVTVTTQSYTNLDAIVAKQVATITEHCKNLSSFTLNVIPATESGLRSPASLALIPTCFREDGVRKALKTLHSRINQLSIVTYGKWETLHHLRKVIADDKRWVEGDKCYGWPGLTLTQAQYAAVSVRQRRYTLAGSEHIVHPHSECIRVFHTSRA